MEVAPKKGCGNPKEIGTANNNFYCYQKPRRQPAQKQIQFSFLSVLELQKLNSHIPHSSLKKSWNFASEDHQRHVTLDWRPIRTQREEKKKRRSDSDPLTDQWEKREEERHLPRSYQKNLLFILKSEGKSFTDNNSHCHPTSSEVHHRNSTQSTQITTTLKTALFDVFLKNGDKVSN